MFKKIFAIPIILLMCITIGCAPAQIIRPSYCEGQPSLIYDTASRMGIDPAVINNMLLVGDTIAIQNKYVDPQVLLKALDAMAGYLQMPLTYRTFVVIAQTYVTRFNVGAGSAILLISPFLTFLDQPMPISDCDRQLLLKCVTDQKVKVLSLIQ